MNWWNVDLFPKLSKLATLICACEVKSERTSISSRGIFYTCDVISLPLTSWVRIIWMKLFTVHFVFTCASHNNNQHCSTFDSYKWNIYLWNSFWWNVGFLIIKRNQWIDWSKTAISEFCSTSKEDIPKLIFIPHSNLTADKLIIDLLYLRISYWPHF